MSATNTTAPRRACLLCASSLVAAAMALAPAQALAQVLDESEFEGTELDLSRGFADLTPTAGNDTVNVSPETALYQPLKNFSAPPDAFTVDFGGGVNTINNNGYLLIGTEYGYVVEQTISLQNWFYIRGNQSYESFMQINNLTTFNNRGDIYLGSYYDTLYDIGLVGTDRWADDILSMPGADFIGDDGSRLFLDANFNATGQTSCSQALRNADGDLPAADCIDLTGGSASGRTLVNIQELSPGDRGAFNPEGNVIVDVSGGDADAISPDAFVIDPASDGYDARIQGVDKGLFAYTVGYDSEDQQFKLYGIQSAAANQFPLLAHVASDLWRTTSGGWFERQIDQRERDSGGGGVWGRVAVSTADRGVSAFSQAGDRMIVFDNSYAQEDTAVTFGADTIVAEGAGGAWAVGAMIGYARSRVDFNDSANTANLEGMHAGVYSGFTAGAFFVDAAINGTWLDLDNDVPAMDLSPAGTIMGTKVQSLGGQVEAGWRFGNDRFSVEPLAGLSVVRTSLEDLNVPADDPARLGGDITFDDATSRRANVGVRLSIEDIVPLTATNRISLTARHGAEFDGEASASIANIGPDAAPVSDTFDGQFSELAATLTAANAAETVAGYVNFGVMFGDDYDRLGVSAGLRFQW